MIHNLEFGCKITSNSLYSQYPSKGKVDNKTMVFVSFFQTRSKKVTNLRYEKYRVFGIVHLKKKYEFCTLKLNMI